MLGLAVASLILLVGSTTYYLLHARLSFRSIYVLGLAAMFPALCMIGLLEALKRKGVVLAGAVPWGQASLIFVLSLLYGGSTSFSFSLVLFFLLLVFLALQLRCKIGSG